MGSLNKRALHLEIDLRRLPMSKLIFLSVWGIPRSWSQEGDDAKRQNTKVEVDFPASLDCMEETNDKASFLEWFCMFFKSATLQGHLFLNHWVMYF
jgi:predicted ATP-binding protein involved in virulence